MPENNVHTITITPRFINPPKEGKTNYSIKDADDFLYSLQPKYLDRIQVGVPVEITYEDRQFNDRWFKMVKAVREVAPAQGANTASAQDSPISKDEHIYVTGVVGRWGGSGKFEATDIKALTLAAADAYDAWLAKRTGKPADLDDEIPY